jgi:hypothetical protein
MGPKIRLYMWLLCALCWSYDLYLWGGLNETPQTGLNLRREARGESPLAATYLFFGGKAVSLAGLSERAQQSAARRFPELIAHPEQTRYLAVSQFKAAQGVVGSACYNLAPILLVLSLIAHWRRQKQIRLFGPPR